MKAEKYIKICIEFKMSLLDIIGELQDLADKYPDLEVWKVADLEFRTPQKKEEK